MAHKICPICDTPTQRSASFCSNCGASLRAVEAVETDTRPRRPATFEYDHQYGETDLAESSLQWKTGTYLLGGVLILAIAACIGIVFFLGLRFYTAFNESRRDPNEVAMTASAAANLAFVTNTPALPTMTLFLPTVTFAPPTPTSSLTPAPSDTPGPCIQQVQAGETLIQVLGRCGHRDLDVIPLVLELNGLEAPEFLQAGQTLEIPWPTATPDPNTAPTATVEGDAESASSVIAGAADFTVAVEDLPGNRPDPTETLQTGVMWHQVVGGEDIITISSRYGANLKIMSELNPQVTFSQCDFGQFGGGPQCIVQIFEGQLLRVPAPTAVPTLSPTPSGSETPTPTATATFNAPSALSPGSRALFQREEFVTLRWVASGTLSAGQVYRVRVEDLTSGQVYTADTGDLSFIVPSDWQGRDNRRHEYRWSVSVIDGARPDDPYFTTEARTFEWEALRETN